MATPVPTTELDAVNECLTAIGVTPVNTLDVPGTTDAAIALDTLRRVSKAVQAKGWWFNQDYNVSFAASGTEVTVGPDYLAIRPSAGTLSQGPETRNFVLRNNKLWDMDNKTHIFNTSVRADVIKEIEFENLPESFRWYVTVRAARIFQTKVLGDETQGVFTEMHELEAWSAVEGDDVVMNPVSTLYLRKARLVGGSLRPDPVTRVNSGGGGSRRQQ